MSSPVRWRRTVLVVVTPAGHVAAPASGSIRKALFGNPPWEFVSGGALATISACGSDRHDAEQSGIVESHHRDVGGFVAEPAFRDRTDKEGLGRAANVPQES